MEVVVSFLGGNPDQPLVIGCLYNGDQRAGVELDAKKTQSLIRTKSSPNSEGFNELRFEDEAGGEFIYTHAQKDYNEEVEHNHSTHVKVDQSNTVDHDQTETVGHNQTLKVKADRQKTVDQNESTEIGQNRTEIVHGSESVTIEAAREHWVRNDESQTVDKGNRTILVKTGEERETFKGGRSTTVHKHDNLHVTAGANRNVHVEGQYNNTVDDHYVVHQGGTERIYLNGHIYISSDAKIELVAPDCSIKMEDGKVHILAANEITLTSGSSTVSLKSDGNIDASGGTQVAISGGSAMGEWSDSGVKQMGPMVEIGADAVTKITGTMVKIN
ncbi:MAG: hypothetical protein KC619_26190 [Myxococcales bacterium]|nr:hypothetical protein [Myxococcales bacterium]